MPVIRLTTGAQKGDKFRVKTRFFGVSCGFANAQQQTTIVSSLIS